MNAGNLPVPAGIKFLYQHLLDSNQIVPIKDYNEDLLHIFPWKVLKMIKEGQSGWEKMIPLKLVELIKDKGLFTSTPKVEELV